MTTDLPSSGVAAPARHSDARRSDARRNHERVIAAARELFTQHGLAVTIPQVAERAGVGKATVYRSYPAKHDLVLAVTRDGFQSLERLTQLALAGADAYRELCAYVPDLFAALAGNRVLADTLFGEESEQATRILEQIGELLAKAQTSGPIRPDVGDRDVRVVLCGTARQLIALDERDPAVWRRYADMVVDAFHPVR
ncbi:TetR/AcrR family transcriptional regulator [Micromonospora sp. NPDC050397]|uniref:TetR/AcrR family transcriptional regulator n=1 Tax=Micromonospora sp. NPDC050397 TaxID=3364279 RepID=UPI00384EE1DC